MQGRCVIIVMEGFMHEYERSVFLMPDWAASRKWNIRVVLFTGKK
jgi:hypothetical protein